MGWWPWLFAGGLAVGLFVAGVVWAFSEPAVQENSKDTPPPTEPRPLEENTRGAAEPLEPLEKPAEDVGDRPEASDLHLVPSEGSEPSVDRSRRSHHAPPTEAGTDRGRAPPESEPVKRAAVQRENPRSRRGIDRSWWREESTGSGVRPMVAPAERPIQPLPLDARPQPEGDGGPSDTAPAPGEASSL